jgi:primosomal protein N' (replication factor Y)
MDKPAFSPASIARIAIPVPLNRLFDYRIPAGIAPETLQPGIRIRVPFGRTHKIGLLLEVAKNSTIAESRLKDIDAVLDQQPVLNSQQLALMHWASRYYHHPIGEVFLTALPVALRKGKAVKQKLEYGYCLTESGRQTDASGLTRAKQQQALLRWFQQHSQILTQTEISTWHKNWRSIVKGLIDKGLVEKTQASAESMPTLLRQPPLSANAAQQQAIETITASLHRFQAYLLEGVTGSGKTEVYLQIIEPVLKNHRQVLILLPEITLTPQLEQRFRQRFQVPIVSSHSRMTDQARLNAWLKMQSGEAAIMLGTRSALFTPLKNPGMIILDEEHDSSFKQQEGFRFSARDVALVQARNLDIPIVLGSATPSLESLYNVQKKRLHKLALPARAGVASKPTFQLLDVRNKKMHDGLSEHLLAQIRQTLARKEQVLLFLNRRGFAPVQMCHSCGYVSRCHRCDANLVMHVADHKLRCHHCGSEQPLTDICPACRSAQLQAVGRGTERVEQTLNELFADKTIIRLDRDSTQRKGSLEDYLNRINQGQVDIILGTQMLAKGHHFPNVTLVAILDVDSGLFSVDFHSAEKMAQMIVQVAGRAGRAEKPGKVLLQTHHPDHPLLITIIQQGYAAFAEAALAERQQAELPPYSFQALLRVQASNPQAPKQFLQELAEKLAQENIPDVLVLGPVIAPMAKKAGQFRYQLLLQSKQRKALHSLLDTMVLHIEDMKSAKKIRWSLDVDPVSLY